MGSAKRERLYPSPSSPKAKKSIPFWVEGGRINDRSGKEGERLRRQGYRLKKGVDY
mgnify:CR=1 FL=1